MPRQNYRQMKKQKEDARKARHAQKQQRRQEKLAVSEPFADKTSKPAELEEANERASSCPVRTETT